MQNVPRACPRCGTPISATVKFCNKCGLPQAAPPPAPSLNGSRARPATQPWSQAQAAGKAPQSLAGAVGALPLGWQTVVGDTLPTIDPLKIKAAQAAARGAPVLTGPSLLPLVIGLAASSFLALATSVVNLDSSGWFTSCLQVVLTVVAVVSGLVADKKRGPVSLVTVAAALGLFLLEGGLLFGIVKGTLTTPLALGSFAGGLVDGGAKLICLLTSLGTAWQVARR